MSKSGWIVRTEREMWRESFFSSKLCAAPQSLSKPAYIDSRIYFWAKTTWSEDMELAHVHIDMQKAESMAFKLAVRFPELIGHLTVEFVNGVR